jgi:hypothetical protein
LFNKKENSNLVIFVSKDLAVPEELLVVLEIKIAEVASVELVLKVTV